MKSVEQDDGGDMFTATPAALSTSRIWRATKRAGLRVFSSEAGLRSAGVAFYGFLSLFPAIAAAAILFGFFLDRSIIESTLDTLSPLLPSGPEEIVQSQLNNLENRDNTSLGWGLLLTLGFALWSGSRGTNAMVYAVTRAYQEDGERTFVKGALLSFGLTLMTYVLAAITIFAIAIIPIVIQLFPLPSFLESAAKWLRWPVIAALILIATIVFYRLAPFRRAASFRWILPGALFATLLWLVGSYAFSLYVENFGSYDATFGSLAAVVVLLLWLYYSAMIFVFGAMLNGELELETLKDTTRGAPRPVGERGAYVADHVTDRLTE